MNTKFPSQDIWEDTPNSLQYTATVSTPQLPEDTEESPIAPSAETDAQAFARRQEELAERESQDSESFLQREKKPWAHKPHLAAEARPGMKQRFPSRDIWEDTPDSLQLETTVAGPQSEDQDVMSSSNQDISASATEEKAADSLPVAPAAIAAASKPQIPARPVKSKSSESSEKSHPIVPERPQRLRQVDGAEGAPLAPTKSKPQVPARPSKPITRESSENVPLTSSSSVKSAGSDTSAAAAAKPKPPVPSRPMGSKIAALQGGFMADLNKRLQLGAQAPKKEEPAPEDKEEEKEKVPLVDARKGRARGPARRAPAKSPAPAVAESVAPVTSFSFSTPVMSWELDPEEDFIHVATPAGEKALVAESSTKVVESETPTPATNTTEEIIHEPPEVVVDTDKDSSLPLATEGLRAEDAEATEKATLVSEPESSNLEKASVKKSDEPLVVPSQNAHLSPGPDDEEDLSASTATLKPSQTNE
jgi:hypothetical protein